MRGATNTRVNTGASSHRCMKNATTQKNLNTLRAIEVSVYVVRAFVKLRELVSTHRELAAKLAALERRVAGHDEDIRSLVAAIRQLMEPPAAGKRRQIGFHARQEGK